MEIKQLIIFGKCALVTCVTLKLNFFKTILFTINIVMFYFSFHCNIVCSVHYLNNKFTSKCGFVSILKMGIVITENTKCIPACNMAIISQENIMKWYFIYIYFFFFSYKTKFILFIYIYIYYNSEI